jgi:hypothetical protein
MLIIKHFVSIYKKTTEGFRTEYSNFLNETLTKENTLLNLINDVTKFNQNTSNSYTYFSGLSKIDLIEIIDYFIIAINQSYSNEHKILLLNQIMILLNNFIENMPAETTSSTTPSVSIVLSETTPSATSLAATTPVATTPVATTPVATTPVATTKYETQPAPAPLAFGLGAKGSQEILNFWSKNGQLPISFVPEKKNKLRR